MIILYLHVTAKWSNMQGRVKCKSYLDGRMITSLSENLQLKVNKYHSPVPIGFVVSSLSVPVSVLHAASDASKVTRHLQVFFWQLIRKKVAWLYDKSKCFLFELWLSSCPLLLRDEFETLALLNSVTMRNVRESHGLVFQVFTVSSWLISEYAEFLQDCGRELEHDDGQSELK